MFCAKLWHSVVGGKIESQLKRRSGLWRQESNVPVVVQLVQVELQGTKRTPTKVGEEELKF